VEAECIAVYARSLQTAKMAAWWAGDDRHMKVYLLLVLNSAQRCCLSSKTQIHRSKEACMVTSSDPNCTPPSGSEDALRAVVVMALETARRSNRP
jgi:hypothetical protein